MAGQRSGQIEYATLISPQRDNGPPLQTAAPNWDNG